MKKLLALFPAVLLTVTLAGCTDNGGEEPKSKTEGNSTVAPSEDLGDTAPAPDGIESTDPGELKPVETEYLNYEVPKGWTDVSEGDVSITGPYGSVVSSNQDSASGSSITVIRAPFDVKDTGDKTFLGEALVDYYTASVEPTADTLKLINPYQFDGEQGAQFRLTKKADGKDYIIFQAAVYYKQSLYVLSAVGTDEAATKGVFDAAVKQWKWTA